MIWKRWKLTKLSAKKTLQLLLPLAIIIIPFLLTTQILGIDIFIDSFEKPESYCLLQNNEKYIIIQKSSHPEFHVDQSDMILHYGKNGNLEFDKIFKIDEIGSIKIYYTIDKNSNEKETIYNTQIVGKVIKTIDDNLLNSISMEIWEISIKNLNIKALITD
jgi:hypothetical protein